MTTKTLKLAEFVGGEEQALQDAALYGKITVKCPFCKAHKDIEPDGHHEEIDCGICFKSFATRGVI